MQNERTTVKWAAEIAMEACVLRKDVADRFLRGTDHYCQNQCDNAYEATQYLMALILRAMMDVKYVAPTHL